MLATIMGIVAAMFLAAVSPLIAIHVEKKVNRIRKERAFDRISNDPLYQVGCWLSCIKQDGTGEPLVGRCLIIEREIGRMVFQIEATSERFSLTGAEFEKLTPIAEAPDSGWIDL